ncbi:putative transporter C3H1.06c [Grifola frondosa]|uniref:Putative transporter C3H1.06c n=1 Tax=Grifola frondosa TaxID=5627 RepID=A0A1C7LM23_GRIFR|nr:putative transporter C3H1.06c [Grifola frondosa]
MSAHSFHDKGFRPMGLEVALSGSCPYVEPSYIRVASCNAMMAVFFGLALCTLVSCLDSTIVATALPTISAAFNAGSVISWVPSAYFLTSTAVQLLYGRFSNIFGRKVTLCLAMGVFMTGSLAAGCSRTINELIVLRGIIGAGGGGIVIIAQIVISDVVSLREREIPGNYRGYCRFWLRRGSAHWRCAMGKSQLAMVLLDHAPCIVLCGDIFALVLPLKPAKGDFRRKLVVVDYLGAVLTLAACPLVILPLIWGGVTFPWTSAIVLAPLFSGIFIVSLFCWWEWKGARLPIVPMYIFKYVTVTGIYIAMFIKLPSVTRQFGREYLFFPCSSAKLLPMSCLVNSTGKYRTIIYLGFSVWAVGCGLNWCRPDTADNYCRCAGKRFQPRYVGGDRRAQRGTLSLAIGATIINNSLRHSMVSLLLPPSTISVVINDPALLGARLTSPSTSPLVALGITPAIAEHILNAYVSGFRVVFILNASLDAVATIACIFMIHHKELTRGDETRLRAEAAEKTGGDTERSSITIEPTPDMERGAVMDKG